MQQDLFSEPSSERAVELVEHSSSNYNPRTGENARKADVTVAFAVDYTTAGERLTHNVAGKKYVAVPYGADIEASASKLVSFMRSVNGRTLNVAGNGIYTLSKHRVSQDAANRWVLAVLERVHAQVGLLAIRSGGQTGIDTAGLVAGLVLGVPVTGLYPKGFRQRLANQTDVERTADELLSELESMAAALKR